MIVQERALLIGREGRHSAVRVWITKRCEDPASNPKVGMALVRLFDHTREAERDLAKSG